MRQRFSRPLALPPPWRSLPVGPNRTRSDTDSGLRSTLHLCKPLLGRDPIQTAVCVAHPYRPAHLSPLAAIQCNSSAKRWPKVVYQTCIAIQIDAGTGNTRGSMCGEQGAEISSILESYIQHDPARRQGMRWWWHQIGEGILLLAGGPWWKVWFLFV